MSNVINLGEVIKIVAGEEKRGSRFRQATTIEITGRPYHKAHQYRLNLKVVEFDEYDEKDAKGNPIIEKQNDKIYNLPVTYIAEHPKFAQVMSDLDELIYYAVYKKDTEDEAKRLAELEAENESVNEDKS